MSKVKVLDVLETADHMMDLLDSGRVSGTMEDINEIKKREKEILNIMADKLGVSSLEVMMNDEFRDKSLTDEAEQKFIKFKKDFLEKNQNNSTTEWIKISEI